LADGGEFLAVQALAAYAVMATTPEEKEALKRSLEALRTKFPSQSRYLDLIAETSR
jgi:hypothetical protein